MAFSEEVNLTISRMTSLVVLFFLMGGTIYLKRRGVELVYWRDIRHSLHKSTSEVLLRFKHKLKIYDIYSTILSISVIFCMRVCVCVKQDDQASL